MIEALIAGERNPTVLAGMAKRRARARIGELTEAVDGRFTDHHARLARMLLDQIDDLTGRVDTVTVLLDAVIEAVPAPSAGTADPDTGEIVGAPSYTGTIERLQVLPGAGPDSVRAVSGEIGLDMSVFGTPPGCVRGPRCHPGPCNRAAKPAEP